MQTLHTSSHYQAYHHPRAGLIVQSTRKAGGVNMRPDHPQFSAYLEALTTAIDAAEADSLCKALLS